MAWKRIRATWMRWIGGAGLVVGFLALYLGIVDAYPVWGFGVACVPFAAILILALQLDSKEKKVGLVCSNCGLRLSGTVPALKVLSTGSCPRCNSQILTTVPGSRESVPLELKLWEKNLRVILWTIIGIGILFLFLIFLTAL